MSNATIMYDLRAGYVLGVNDPSALLAVLRVNEHVNFMNKSDNG